MERCRVTRAACLWGWAFAVSIAVPPVAGGCSAAARGTTPMAQRPPRPDGAAGVTADGGARDGSATNRLLLGDAGMAGPTASEQCDNGLDDDSDGRADEECACAPGAMQECFLVGAAQRGVGACTPGRQSCVARGEFGTWGDCTGAGVPSAEACDSLDNDCDGAVDEDLGGVTCGVGACVRSVAACVDGAAPACAPGPALTEVCASGVDEDCNGVVDDCRVCIAAAATAGVPTAHQTSALATLPPSAAGRATATMAATSPTSKLPSISRPASPSRASS